MLRKHHSHKRTRVPWNSYYVRDTETTPLFWIDVYMFLFKLVRVQGVIWLLIFNVLIDVFILFHGVIFDVGR